jgi:hypothetical protein
VLRPSLQIRQLIGKLAVEAKGIDKSAGSVNDGDCPVDLNVFADLLSRFRVKAEKRQRLDTDEPKYQGACLPFRFKRLYIGASEL